MATLIFIEASHLLSYLARQSALQVGDEGLCPLVLYVLLWLPAGHREILTLLFSLLKYVCSILCCRISLGLSKQP